MLKAKREKLIRLLSDSIDKLEKAIQSLKLSYDECKQIFLNKELSFEEQKSYEALCSRFSRTSDFLFQKCFRTLAKINQDEYNSNLDLAHLVEQYGIAPKADVVIEIRELRNEIVHEYAEEMLNEIYKEVLRLTPELILIANKFIKYFHHHYDKYFKT